MKRNLRMITLIPTSFVATLAVLFLLQVLALRPVQAAACNVPTGTHPTIQSAVNDASCDTVSLTAALYIENVMVNRSVVIQGQGWNSTAIDGGGVYRVLTIESGLVVTLSNLTVQNGFVNGLHGGGIHNDNSELALLSTRLVSNTLEAGAQFGHGVGLYNNGGQVLIDNSIIMGNLTTGYNGTGGGVANGQGGVMKIIDSTIIGNYAEVGGGIDNRSAILYLINSAVSHNTADSGGGGAIFNGYGAITITNSLLDNNVADTWGGALLTFGGTSYISESIFMDNEAHYGGGLYNFEGLTQLEQSTLSNNFAWDGGGAVVHQGGALGINQSTLDSNQAQYLAGAIWNMGNTTIQNTTFSSNRVNWGIGGAILNQNGSMLQLNNSTLTLNQAYDPKGGGGGIFNRSDGVITMTNNIVASNTAGQCAGDAPITSLGYNIASDGSCGLGGPGDLPNTEPLLGPLQNNGGPTWTHALLVGSPAIDAGNNENCPAVDQRGFPRPLDGDEDGNAECDIGAYEYKPLPLRFYLPFVSRQ